MCLSMKQEIHFTEHLGKLIQSGNKVQSVYVILEKKISKNSTQNIA